MSDCWEAAFRTLAKVQDTNDSRGISGVGLVTLLVLAVIVTSYMTAAHITAIRTDSYSNKGSLSRCLADYNTIGHLIKFGDVPAGVDYTSVGDSKG